MNRFNYVKNMTVDELAEFIVNKARAIEMSRNAIRSIGADPDSWETWKDVIKKHLLEEMKK